MFRKLKANEIEARIGQVKEKGLTLLLYKDARCDMQILDETVGPLNWTRQHTRDNANCVVSIYDKEKNSWTHKEDTGTESFTEKEKGLASDSFKRACVNWGIGRELYTSPFIWINAADADIKANNGKYSSFEKFEVKSIGYDNDGVINHLIIANAKSKKEVFKMGTPGKAKLAEGSTVTKANIQSLLKLAAAKGIKEIDIAKVAAHDYGVSGLEELKQEEFAAIYNRISKK